MPPLSCAGLRVFFWLARRAPRLVRSIRPLGIALTLCASSRTRRGIWANSRRLLGDDVSFAKRVAFVASVVGSFYDFVTDVARCAPMSADELRGQIETIEGREAYIAHRRRERRGAIIVTAHMGSFEVGLAALTEVEQHIHVVFKRDALDGYEMVRGDLRKTLGIDQTPIDDGWDTWMKLRDALNNDHVVVMQGDRAMPGQKAQAVPMFGAHLSLPLGPVKLAAITGSPIVPVFTLRTPGGRCRVIAQPPIYVDPRQRPVDGIDPALRELGRAIERFVGRYPHQWLVLSPAFVEDGAGQP